MGTVLSNAAGCIRPGMEVCMRMSRRLRLKIAGKPETVKREDHGRIYDEYVNKWSIMLPTYPPKYPTTNTAPAEWKVERPQKGWSKAWRKNW